MHFYVDTVLKVDVFLLVMVHYYIRLASVRLCMKTCELPTETDTQDALYAKKREMKNALDDTK